MGVRGLTTYINNNRNKFLKKYQLHNSHLILDGYSIATNLFIHLNTETAFGGNYDAYALYVKEFFKLLKKCNIKPIVIFDGGYERRKLRTVYKRMRDKIVSAKNITIPNSVPNFPLFMRHIFREVLIEIGVPFAQTDFEADDEIAAVARQLQCPVLSYDSDFYIFDVMYIPFPSLTLEAEPLMDDGKRIDGEFYLNCELYEIDYFLNNFGGLDKSMLPLLATLLGNDYIKRSLFKSFYQNLKLPKSKKMNRLQARITALLAWLRNETMESALFKILSRMKQKRRKYLAFKINSVIQGYTKCTSSLDAYLPLDITKTKENNLNIESIINRIENTTVEESDEDTNSNSDDEESDEDSAESECDDAIKNVDELNDDESFEIPHWLIDSMRKGNIHSSVMDILTLRTYFCPVQVEDYNLSHSHRISLPILSVVVGLLLGSNQRIRYWVRNDKGNLEWFSLDSIAETKTVKFPRLERLNLLSAKNKITILLETLNLETDLTLFPSDWQLFVIAILFWLKNMTEPLPTMNHLHAMVMCIIALQVMSSLIGTYKTKRDFMKRFSKHLKKLNSISAENKIKSKTVNVKDSNMQAKNEETEKIVCNLQNSCNVINEKSTKNVNNPNVTIKENFNNVTKSDCILMFEKLYAYHCFNEQLLSKHKLFCISTVHSFAQFQSCLHHIMLLNSILDFPLKQCTVHKIFSGMFAYNVYSDFKAKANIEVFIKTLFKNAPTLLVLYESIVKTFVSLLPQGHLVNIVKAKKKKKKVKCKTKNVNDAENTIAEAGDEELFLDKNNKFSLLAIT